jgi:tetratricopeptide (TPR) repeat protein
MLRKFFSLMLVFVCTLTLTACGSQYRVEREGMPEKLETKLEEQVAAGEEMLKVAESDAEKTTALLEIAFGNEQIGKLDEAIVAYKELLKIDPNHFPALNNLGVIYEEVGELETSAQYYGQLLEANPSNTGVFGDAIRVLVAAGRFEEAQTNLENFARYNQGSDNENFQRFVSTQFEFIRNAKAKAEEQ